jgi:hypothetical protein
MTIDAGLKPEGASGGLPSEERRRFERSIVGVARQMRHE